MNIKYKPYALLAFLLISLNSCDDLFNDGLTIKMDKTTFDKERKAWDDQNIKNYRFKYAFSNDATGPTEPIEITIKENEPPIVEDKENYGTDVKNIPEIYEHINGTFSFIESVKNGTYKGPKINSLTLDITYNTQYHYPQKVNFLEGYVEDVDGGGYYTLEIKDFSPINNE